MNLKSAGNNLKSGRAISCIGNNLVVESLNYCKLDDSLPNVGCSAFAENKKIGRVVDIIGRIEKPYVIVKLDSAKTPATANLVGKEIKYGSIENDKRKRGRIDKKCRRLKKNQK